VKHVRNFCLPSHEEHLVPFLERGPEFAGGPTYQLHKLLAALPHVQNFRCAVDVGGHCGLWSRPMAAMFHVVHAFEPVAEHQACFAENMRAFEIHNVMLHKCALGERTGEVSLHTSPSSSGDTYVKDGGEHSAEMRRLDDFRLENVDFVKLDCEGYEIYALRGGEQTIRQWKPVIVVEQKPGKGSQFGLGDTDAVKLLTSWGYRQQKVISGDYILSC
jgi:FkbM family methyltransferase